jgi:hypothetical protein
MRLPSYIGILAFALSAPALSAKDKETDKQSKGMPLVFSEDFEQGCSRWETTDENAWSLHKAKWSDQQSETATEDPANEAEKTNQVFGLNRRISEYQPKVRSPHNIALIKDIELEDFVLIFRVRSTKDTGNHRDCCAFFGHQDTEHYYYVHLGAKPDPHSGQIMIVNGEPRRAITENTKLVPWDDKWHTVKIVRESKAGVIEVYFDDMETPHMRAVDKSFGKGRIGIGSFDDMNDFDNVVLYGN